MLGVVIGAVLAVVVLATVVEAVMDYFSISLDPGLVAQTVVTQPQFFAVPLVAIEEAGLPLPISGDLIIMYSASRVGPNPYALLALGVVLELVVLLGSSFLFLVSRRWATQLLVGPLGRAMRLTPARLERAQGWFRHWGIWAVICGRLVPGFRVAVTVVAASLGLSYRLFIFGVAISATIWITLFMTLGLLVGTQSAQLLGAHQNSSLLILGGVLLVGLIYIALRLTWRASKKSLARS